MTTRRPWFLTVLIAILPVCAEGQQVCPCVPIAHEWIVDACTSWNCAVAAAIMADGSSDVLPVPSGSDDFKWVVLRRIAVGSAIIPPDAPFRVESFTVLSDAMARFSAIDPDLRPLLFTAPDGSVLIVSRSTAQPRRRATGK
jgi:hypothetical protein